MKRILLVLLCFSALIAAGAQSFVIGDLKYTVTDAEKHEVEVAANTTEIELVQEYQLVTELVICQESRVCRRVVFPRKLW